MPDSVMSERFVPGPSGPESVVLQLPDKDQLDEGQSGKAMLEGAPWLLAHKSMLAVNKPRKISLYGQDYVLWKDRNHDVHALPNACPHLGAALSGGWCEAQSDGSSQVVCPFHALAFDGEGCTVLPAAGQPVDSAAAHSKKTEPKKTKPLVSPLPLIVQGDFVWTYGGHVPQRPIPTVLNEIAAEYAFVGAVADTSVNTPLLPMLLNMHDYDHQNGTHRDLFRIEPVMFRRFVDEGHRSEALFTMPTARPTWREILRNPAVLTIPRKIEAHLENHFPSLVIFHGDNAAGTIAQVHLFLPESAERTRTYALLFAKPKSPIFMLMKKTFLNLVGTVVEQDAVILNALYAGQPQKVRLRNEVGMDWVRRNYRSWPEQVGPDLSK